MKTAPFDHSRCDFAGKKVTCERCGRTYVCTPEADYYCAAEGDHCCEPCLVGGLPVVEISEVDLAYRQHWDPDHGNEPDAPQNVRAAFDPYQYDV